MNKTADYNKFWRKAEKQADLINGLVIESKEFSATGYIVADDELIITTKDNGILDVSFKNLDKFITEITDIKSTFYNG